MQKSFFPYIKQLDSWLYFGEINDIYGEFLIQENQVNKKNIEVLFNDNFWDAKFVLKDSIPNFLQKQATMILRTGKYLNVLRECKKNLECGFTHEML